MASRPEVFSAIIALLAVAPAMASSSRLAGSLPGKTDTGHVLDLNADVACPPEQAEALWSTADGLQSFFAPKATVGDIGGPYVMAFYPEDDPDGVRYGTSGARLLAREPSRFLAFEWVTFSADAQKGPGAPPAAPPELLRPAILPTWVELTFVPMPSSTSTRVTLRHLGFGEGALWRESQSYFTAGWSAVLSRMQSACAAKGKG
jgi:uncharacterized protein YndB with AHSA1/START domain